MLIDRSITTLIKDKLAGEPKVIVLYGPRQSGKTVLLNEIAGAEKRKKLSLKGEDVRIQEVFSVPRYDTLKSYLGDTEVLIIDEAQKIDNIGSSLKLIFDSSPIHIIVSGSASFDLANKLAEPMTGRATFFTLYPLSVFELDKEEVRFGLDKKLPDLLRFGMYPKIHTLGSEVEKQDYLHSVISTYLYNDLLSFNEIKKPKKILDLLSLLALQIGNEVNIWELSKQLLLDRQTVEKYLDVLEKMFIVINLRGFSRNLRKEITKTSKYYFVDLGLRNALIRNFNPLRLRGDVGGLFENFCVIERMKALSNQRKHANFYFWRTYDQKEIDLIEERDGKLNAFAFKFGDGKIPQATKKEFLHTYPDSTLTLINTENIEESLTR
ncbi:MAG: ATP-binding protein [Patescibacteria group bacterium]